MLIKLGRDGYYRRVYLPTGRGSAYRLLGHDAVPLWLLADRVAGLEAGAAAMSATVRARNGTLFCTLE